MEAESLVRMANRIGDFFAAMPDRDEALDGIASHVRKFWEPRMRTQLRQIVSEGGEGLSPIVQAALRDRLFKESDLR